MACAGLTFGDCSCDDDSGGGGDVDSRIVFGRRWTGSSWQYYNAVETEGVKTYKVPRTGRYYFFTSNVGVDESAIVWWEGRIASDRVAFGHFREWAADTLIFWTHSEGDGPPARGGPGYYQWFVTSLNG